MPPLDSTSESPFSARIRTTAALAASVSFIRFAFSPSFSKTRTFLNSGTLPSCHPARSPRFHTERGLQARSRQRGFDASLACAAAAIFPAFARGLNLAARSENAEGDGKRDWNDD